MTLSRSSRFLLGVLFVLLLLAPFVRTARHLEVFGDEIGFIRAGDGAVSLLLSGNLSPEAWRSDEWGSYGWMNPQLSKVISGLAVRVGAPRNFQKEADGKLRLDITPRVLGVARTPAVLFALGSCVLILLIGARISPAVGVLAAVVAAFNRFYRVQVCLALLEAPAAFFSLLVVLLLLKLHDALESDALASHVPRLSAFLGLALGLALVSKYLCGILWLFALLYLAVVALHRGMQQKLRGGAGRRLLIAAVFVAALPAATFFVLSPQFYDRPISEYRHTMRAWSELWANQRFRWQPESRVDNLTHSVEVTLGALLLNTTSQHIVDTLSVRINRVGLRTLVRSYVYSAFNLESVCVLLAAALIIVRRWRAGPGSGWTDQELLLAWLIWTFAIFVVWLPLSFPHYFMYPFLPTPLLIGIGAVEGFRRLRA